MIQTSGRLHLDVGNWLHGPPHAVIKEPSTCTVCSRSSPPLPISSVALMKRTNRNLARVLLLQQGRQQQQQQQRARQSLQSQRSRRRGLQWPLLRALAAALVYLGTATGAAAANTTPAKLRLNGNNQQGVPIGDGARTTSSGGDGGGRRAQERRHQSAAATGGPSNSGSQGAISPGSWDLGVSSGTVPRRRIGSHTGMGVPGWGRTSAAISRGGGGGGGLAFLPAATSVGARQTERQDQLRLQPRCSFPFDSLRARGTASAAAGPARRRRPRGTALMAARSLADDGETSSKAGGGGAAKLPLRRRQRQGPGKDLGDWRPSLYMRVRGENPRRVLRKRILREMRWHPWLWGACVLQNGRKSVPGVAGTIRRHGTKCVVRRRVFG